ncbi:MAG: hypothetical protein ACPGQL_00290 [Thermoplasmatota archaeon]
MRGVVLAASLLLIAALVPIGPAAAEIIPQNDAGSGRDAPGPWTGDDILVEPSIVYHAQLFPDGDESLLYDDLDWYMFEAAAGDVVHLRWSGSSCAHIYAAPGEELAGACPFDMLDPTGIRATIPEDGTYFIGFWGLAAIGDYRFLFEINQDAATFPMGPSDGAYSVAIANLYVIRSILAAQVQSVLPGTQAFGEEHVQLAWELAGVIGDDTVEEVLYWYAALFDVLQFVADEMA